MPEATSTTTVASWAAYLSAVTLALLGVDYYALLGAFGGVLFMLSSVRPTGRCRVVLTVSVTTFVAAALGQGLAAAFGLTGRAIVIAISVVVGAGGQVIVQAAVAAIVARLQKLGGQQEGQGQ